jgi:hypothetical protein
MHRWPMVGIVLLACSEPAPRPSTRSDPSMLSDAADAGTGVAQPVVSQRPDGGPLNSVPPELLPRFALPRKAGTARSEVEGCAAHPETADLPATRTMPSPARVAVRSVVGGIIVTHSLPHACCLKGSVEARLDRNVATVREVLSGTPCRCMCESTLRTGMALDPGDYRLVLEMERAGRVETVDEETVTVR